MGCFSFLCKKSGKPALSTSFNGSPCYLFLLKNGKVIEEMYGNYDSYGRVFKTGLDDSFEWAMSWDDVCDLMFSGDPANGIALILENNYDGVKPTTQSEDDPNQGWSDEDENYLTDYSNGPWKRVENPYHKVF